jgi:hypothetical protein
MDASPLVGWENFYVITGSSAGGLTGLTFVVIALVRDAQGVRSGGLRIFVTPTTVHFSAVLGLAAFLSMPWHGVLSLSVGFGVAGVCGLAYCAFIARSIGRMDRKEYAPVWEDWIWHAILPTVAYGLLLLASDLIWHWRMQSLYAAAAASLILLFSGIHNAWDIAVWMTLKKTK